VSLAQLGAVGGSCFGIDYEGPSSNPGEEKIVVQGAN